MPPPARGRSNQHHQPGTLCAALRLQAREDREARPPKGKPLSEAELAALFRAADEPHIRMFLLGLCCTLARPEALLQVNLDTQYDLEAGLLALNPPGRRQTKKRRALIPVAPVLAEALKGKTGPLIAYHGSPVKDAKIGWRCLRARAFPPTPEQLEGLPEPTTTAERRKRAMLCAEGAERIVPYSIRHTLARALRRARVPAEQISLMLGHVVSDSRDVTEIYAPYDPDYCVDAVGALDIYVRRVLALAAAPVSPGYHPNALLGSAAGAAKSLKLLVGATGFEPVTPTMST